ncbi:MAG: hypothetical protein ACI8QS_002310 [Planctomycetota bacterium]|jgi:hypothetical protein
MGVLAIADICVGRQPLKETSLEVEDILGLAEAPFSAVRAIA